eukprot:228955-Pelagomonas_calceolata.AAC.1
MAKQKKGRLVSAYQCDHENMNPEFGAALFANVEGSQTPRQMPGTGQNHAAQDPRCPKMLLLTHVAGHKCWSQACC